MKIMNIRNEIREAIAEAVDITPGMIRDAIESMELDDLITDAISEILPMKLECLVTDLLEEAVADAIDEALS